MSSVK